MRFQSTLPVRGATLSFCRFPFAVIVSIHAPRAGSDRHTPKMLFRLLSFNPRSPCGERQQQVRRAGQLLVVSIHAPRAGSDPKSIQQCVLHEQFQSTLPVRGATLPVISLNTAEKFQSTLPVRGATVELPLALHINRFQSTLPVRGATIPVGTLVGLEEFQSTLPIRQPTIDAFQSTLSVRGATCLEPSKR